MLKKSRCILLAVLIGTALTAGSRGDSEYGLKASCLYNFAKFVTWPNSAFAGADSPLVIGILGEDPFGKELDNTIAGKEVNGHPLKVKRFADLGVAQAGGVKKCHILFICLSEKDKLSEVLGAIKGASILTISEIDNFPLKGGILLFGMEGSKISLQVNAEASKKAKLEISSKLLQVCKIYKSGD